MDIYCPRCGEPCDMDELHDARQPYNVARRLFFNPAEGCGIVFSDTRCTARRTDMGDKAYLAAQLLGDDVDGIASILDDGI